MRLRKKLLVLAPAVALAAASLAAIAPGEALAGVGYSQECNDNFPSGSEIHLLTSPITLEVESPTFALGTVPTYLQVCYSTTPYGTTSTPSEGGVFDVYVAWPGTGTGAACANDPASVLTVSCLDTVNPSATFTPGSGGGGTITLAIPITLCLSTGLVPNTGGCFGTTPTLGGTGVVVGTFSLTPPPAGYTTGGGFTLSGLSLVVNGQSVSLLGGTTQAGVNPAVVGAGTGQGITPICVLTTICAPGIWAGEQPISAAEIVVAGIPVAVPPVVLGCLVNINTTCPPPY